jgi:toxin YxiD
LYRVRRQIIIKVLDVHALHNGIDQILEKLESQQIQIKGIESKVNEIVSLDSFSGKGGKAIRSFYQECHIPFLVFYQQFLINYKQQSY